LEGFQLGTPPFTWIRIAAAEIGKFSEDFEGIIEAAWYTELPAQQLLDDHGRRTHPDTEYVLTREDVGYFIGVRYDVEMTVDVVVEGQGEAAAAGAASNENKTEGADASQGDASVSESAAQSEAVSASAGKDLAGAVAPQGPATSEKTATTTSAPAVKQEVRVVHKYLALTSHGAVKPGPPRLTDFDVTGSMKVSETGSAARVS
jgi:hypothetical protein